MLVTGVAFLFISLPLCPYLVFAFCVPSEAFYAEDLRQLLSGELSSDEHPLTGDENLAQTVMLGFFPPLTLTVAERIRVIELAEKLRIRSS